MTHSEMNELYELYLLGLLEPEEAAEITEHLNRDCEYCAAHLDQASAVLGSLSMMTEPTTPSARLRERVLAIARPSQPKAAGRLLSFAFTLAAAASIAAIIWGVSEQSSLQQTMAQLTEVSRQRNQLRAAIEILTESDTRTAKFGEAEAAPHGRVFLSRNGGVFLGNHLPELANGKTFELWLVPAKGNPQSAGLFIPNSAGISVNVLSQNINPSEYAAIAVSVEPNGGSPQPTSKPIIVVPLA